MIYFGLILTGLAAGVLSGLFGIGGGIVVVPSLVLGLGYTQRAANGTSLCALLLPVGILGAWNYYKTGAIGQNQVFAALFIAVGMFVGAYLGSKLAFQMSEPLLKRGFAVFLVVVAVKLWMDAR